MLHITHFYTYFRGVESKSGLHFAVRQTGSWQISVESRIVIVWNYQRLSTQYCTTLNEQTHISFIDCKPLKRRDIIQNHMHKYVYSASQLSIGLNVFSWPITSLDPYPLDRRKSRTTVLYNSTSFSRVGNTIWCQTLIGHFNSSALCFTTFHSPYGPGNDDMVHILGCADILGLCQNRVTPPQFNIAWRCYSYFKR